jgi:hypothetical protein
MSLTAAQLATLKAFIASDPTLSAQPLNTDGAFAIAEAMNAAASPAFTVWRSSVPVEEYRDAVTWTEVDALTVGKARIWEWLTGNMTQPLETARAPVRQGLADCWGAATTTRAALLAAAKRSATIAEKLFATGTGTVASPATMEVEGLLDYHDVHDARLMP